MTPVTPGNVKAWTAALAAAIASFLATVQGRTDLDTMRAVDWIIVVLSALLAGITVWTVPPTTKGLRQRRTPPAD